MPKITSERLVINPKTRFLKAGNKTIMFNSLHGRPLVPSEGLLELLNVFKKPINLTEIGGQLSKESEKILNDLQLRGFLITPSENGYEKVVETEKKRFAEDMNGLNLYNLRLNVTSSCNLACRYCYVYQRREEITSFKSMSPDIAKKAITLFFDFMKKRNIHGIANHAIPKIRYFGGEPLLNFSLVRESVELTDRLNQDTGMNVRSIINTNGTIYNPEIEHFLRGKDLDLIISWDGLGDYHDLVRCSKNGGKSSKIIQENFEKMVSHGIIPTISCVLSETNKNHLKEFIDYLAEKGLKYFGLSVQTVSQAHNEMSPEEKASKLIEIKDYAKERNIEVDGPWSWQYRLFNDNEEVSYCGAMGGEIHVSETGMVHPCHLVKLELGNVTKIKSLGELFESNDYKKFVSRTISSMHDYCGNCELEGLCAGGCPAEAYERTGDYYNIGDGCDFKKEITEKMLINLVNCSK